MDRLTVELPWPDKALNPNARVHFMPLAIAKRKAKNDACSAALAAGARYLRITGRPMVTFEWLPPDRRRRDVDNLLASMKSAIDGIAKAIMIDDSAWEWRLLPISQTRKPGACIVTITDSKTKEE